MTETPKERIERHFIEARAGLNELDTEAFRHLDALRDEALSLVTLHRTAMENWKIEYDENKRLTEEVERLRDRLKQAMEPL